MSHSEVTLKLDKVIESNLKSPTDRFISANVVGESSQARFLRVESKFKPMFVIQSWHKLYAGALMESDSTRLCLFIILTEEAILERYIALIAEASESDEILDLQNAVAVLSELREANQIGLAVSKLVA